MARLVGFLLLGTLGVFSSAVQLRGPVLQDVKADTGLRTEDQAKLNDLESALGDMKKEDEKRDAEAAAKRVGAWTVRADSVPERKPEHVETPADAEPHVELEAAVDQAADGAAANRLDSLDGQLHQALSKSPLGELAAKQAESVPGAEGQQDELAAKLGGANKLTQAADAMDAFYAHTPAPDAVIGGHDATKDGMEATEDLRESEKAFDDPNVKQLSAPKKHSTRSESWRNMADRLAMSNMPSLD